MNLTPELITEFFTSNNDGVLKGLLEPTVDKEEMDRFVIEWIKKEPKRLHPKLSGLTYEPERNHRISELK